jgi:hypothetical protein
VPDPVPASFEVDGPASSPSIALELRALTDDAVMLDVVGRGIDHLYGLSFRVETAPDVLALETLEASSLWEPMPSSIVRSIEARPGLGLFVITAQGEQIGIGADGEALGTLHLRRKPGDSPVRFVTERCAAIDDAGQPIADVAWIGGTLHDGH